MRDYREMAQTVLRRRDEAEAARKKRQKSVRRTAAAAASLCAAAVLAFGLAKNPAWRPPDRTGADFGMMTQTADEAAVAETTGEAARTVTTPDGDKRTATAEISAVRENDRQTTAAAPAGKPGAQEQKNKTWAAGTTPAAPVEGKPSGTKMPVPERTKELLPELPAATTTAAVDDDQGDEEYMKKYTAFVTAILTFAGLLPVNANAEEWRDLTDDELVMISTAEEYGVIVDANDNGEYDICDFCEFYRYNKAYYTALDEIREKYGYWGDKYHTDELSEAISVFNQAYIDKLREQMIMVNYDVPVAVDNDMYAVYYLYKNGTLPTAGEIKTALEGYQFHSSDGTEYVEEFCEYVEGVRQKFMKRTVVPTAEEEVIFAKLDSGELEKDLNGDGVFDYFDYEDMTQTLFSDYYAEHFIVPFVPQAVSGRIAELGDLNEDGSFDEKDAALLARYYFRDNDYVPSSAESGRHIADLRTRFSDSSETPDMAAAPASGDANCDGTVNLNDAVAVLQYIAMPAKYPLTAEGLKNADVHNTGNGVDGMDALALQQWDAYS